MAAMAAFKLGVHIRPQHTTVQAMREAWKTADALGVDSITMLFSNPIDRDAVGRQIEFRFILSRWGVVFLHDVPPLAEQGPGVPIALWPLVPLWAAPSPQIRLGSDSASDRQTQPRLNHGVTGECPAASEHSRQ